MGTFVIEDNYDPNLIVVSSLKVVGMESFYVTFIKVFNSEES